MEFVYITPILPHLHYCAPSDSQEDAFHALKNSLGASSEQSMDGNPSQVKSCSDVPKESKNLSNLAAMQSENDRTLDVIPFSLAPKSIHMIGLHVLLYIWARMLGGGTQGSFMLYPEFPEWQVISGDTENPMFEKVGLIIRLSF